MRLKSLLAVGAFVAGATALPACGTETTTQTEPAEVVTSGECPGEAAVVRRALDQSRVKADVDGDGRPDTVAVASRPEAAKPCRALVGVRVHGGSTYSTHLIPNASPVKGLPAEVVGLPLLANQSGAHIVVDTKAAVDSVLAQMFTLASGRLLAVEVPGLDEGTFIVEGGGLTFPHGAACTAGGRMVLTEAALTKDGKRYRVTRRTYEVEGPESRFGDPVVEKATVDVNELAASFPEFTDPHWKDCTGTVGL